MLPVILGSSAPSRRAVLRAEGVAFESRSPDIDERAVEGRSDGPPSSLVLAVARAKLDALRPSVALDYPGGALLICCDQVVVGPDGLRPLEKPVDEEEARSNMRAFSSATASCVSGVVVCDTRSGRSASGVAVTTVHLDELTAADQDEILRPATAVPLTTLRPLVVSPPLPAGVTSARARSVYGTLEEHGRAVGSDGTIGVFGCAGALCVEHPGYARRVRRIDGDGGLDGAHGLPWLLLLRLVGEAVEGATDGEAVEAGLRVLLGVVPS
jgi:predicted house-cleaning NTP pyrophosphatase (Maf/HAM1 superfamily)